MIPRVLVTSQGPVAAGAVVFRDNHGQFVCTIVAKISYSIGAGIVPPLDEALPIQEEDGHWDDDPARSVHVPSDLVPFKKAPEVVVVGSAFAPGDRPAANVMTRVIVGSVDKSVEVFAPRFVRDGTIEEGPRGRRFSLRYEYAAGGADSDNPMGINIGRADPRGRRPIPQILPVACDVGPQTTYLPTIGLGPLPATSRARAEEVRPVDRAWIADMTRDPLPLGFPSSYFQSAPADHWLSRPLVANERMVLENLHQNQSRMVMTLPGLEPVAVFVGQTEPLRLRGDLLVIDSDRALCTLTFRGHVPLSEARHLYRAVVAITPMGSTLTPDQVQNIVQSVSGTDSLHDVYETVDDDFDTTRDIAPHELANVQSKLAATVLPFSGSPTTKPPTQNRRLGTITTVTNRPEVPSPNRSSYPEKSLPFAPASQPPGRQPSYPDGVLATPPVPAPPIQPPPLSRPPVPPPVPPSSMRQPSFADGMLGAANNATPAMPPPMVTAGRVLGVPNAPPPLSAVVAPSAVEATLRAESQSVATPVEPAKPVSLMNGLRARETQSRPLATPSNQGAGAKASPLGVQAASDAAANEEKSRVSAAREVPSRNLPPSVRRLAVIDLLKFEPEIATRLRGMKRLSPLWAAMPKAKSPLNPDEPQRLPPDPDREIVLRVLSCTEGQTPAEIRRALGESLEDLADFDPPLVICAGELQPKFDDMEALRVFVAVASSVAGTDKRMLGAIAVAQEALSATLPPAPETLRNLAKQLETASGSLNLPPRFLVGHVERILVENRHYKRRTILGSVRVRADLVFANGDVFPLYLLDESAKSLPLLPSFPVMTVCEVRPREDLTEALPEALLCVALGRVLHGRNAN